MNRDLGICTILGITYMTFPSRVQNWWVRIAYVKCKEFGPKHKNLTDYS